MELAYYESASHRLEFVLKNLPVIILRVAKNVAKEIRAKKEFHLASNNLSVQHKFPSVKAQITVLKMMYSLFERGAVLPDLLPENLSLC